MVAVLGEVLPRFNAFEAKMGNLATMVERLTRPPPEERRLDLVIRRLVGVSGGGGWYCAANVRGGVMAALLFWLLRLFS